MMNRIEKCTEETRQAAMKLLEADMEMLHSYPPDGQHCRYCDVWREHASFADECPALLRCALQTVWEKARRVESRTGCGVCGSRMVEIRGRYPRDADRLACPTCAVERLEQIREISDRDYGRAFQATDAKLIQPTSALSGNTNDS